MQIWDPGVPVEKKQKIYKYKALWRDLCVFLFCHCFLFFSIYLFVVKSCILRQVKHPAGWETEPTFCLFLAFICLDIGCETHGFGKQFNSWYSPCHCVLVFFLHFAMFSAFMSFQNQRHFFAVFLKYAGFSTFLRAFFSIAKGQSSRLDSLIQDFAEVQEDVQ